MLDITRSKVQHVTFGYGIHFCIGAPLARIEAPMFFGKLLERFDTLEPAWDDLSWQPTVGFRGLECLPVRVG